MPFVEFQPAAPLQPPPSAWHRMLFVLGLPLMLVCNFFPPLARLVLGCTRTHVESDGWLAEWTTPRCVCAYCGAEIHRFELHGAPYPLPPSAALSVLLSHLSACSRTSKAVGAAATGNPTHTSSAGSSMRLTKSSAGTPPNTTTPRAAPTRVSSASACRSSAKPARRPTGACRSRTMPRLAGLILVAWRSDSRSTTAASAHRSLRTARRQRPIPHILDLQAT